jgi:hypothetical protein
MIRKVQHYCVLEHNRLERPLEVIELSRIVGPQQTAFSHWQLAKLELTTDLH